VIAAISVGASALPASPLGSSVGLMVTASPTAVAIAKAVGKSERVRCA
jgi:hypothetical protein